MLPVDSPILVLYWKDSDDSTGIHWCKRKFPASCLERSSCSSWLSNSMYKVDCPSSFTTGRNTWEDSFYAEWNAKDFEAILRAYKCEWLFFKCFSWHGRWFGSLGLIIHEHAHFYRFLCIITTVWLICQAVRSGDLELFGNVAEEFAGTFISDGTKNLIVRLQHSVIRTGLRSISISYSSISLAEVADKLKMHSRNLLADVENVVAKAIRDGAINAKIDHANGWLISKETRDIYATAEPQVAFSSRISFCLNLYNETVRALLLPSGNDMHANRRSASQVLYGELLELLEEVRGKYLKKWCFMFLSLWPLTPTFYTLFTKKINLFQRH